MSDELTEVKSLLPAMPAPEEFKKIFAENCEGITPSFETISIPTGGGVAFTITNESGEQDVLKELRAVILDHYPCRAYWPGSYAGGNELPECASLDARTGNKYGACDDCEFSQWGSEYRDGERGRGQACKKMRRLFVLFEGQTSIFPYMLVLPPTSSEGRYGGSFSAYSIMMTGRMKKLSEIQTKIKLITDKNKDGIVYSKAQFFFIKEIPEGDKAKIDFLKKSLKDSMRQKPVTEMPEDNIPF